MPILHNIPVIKAELREALDAAASGGGGGGAEWHPDGAGLHTTSDAGGDGAAKGNRRNAAWEQLPLLVNGQLKHGACASFFKATCSILQEIPELQIRNGQTKISKLEPGTVIRPHCGPVGHQKKSSPPKHLLEDADEWLRPT